MDHRLECNSHSCLCQRREREDTQRETALFLLCYERERLSKEESDESEYLTVCP